MHHTRAVLQELGAAIVDFREAQKGEPETMRRFAWVSTDTFGEAGGGVGMQQYYLASHFDKIFMQPSGMLGLLGVHQPGAVSCLGSAWYQKHPG